MNTLQNLCIEEIVSEFSRYHQAYCSTEDSSLKLKFEFLKKKYSFHILQKLNEECDLKIEYLDFLINKYLKVLDTRWLKGWPWEDICSKFAEIGSNLEEVIFSDRPWDKVLCFLPNLKRIFFQHHCSDEFLAHLAIFCSCVETLDIKYSSLVSDLGLKNLCGITSKNPCCSRVPVKELIIESTKVGDEGIAYLLENMPSLEKIDYWKLPEILYSMHKSDINAFDKIRSYNLTHLNLMYMDHKDIFNVLTVCVFACPHLKSLSCPILQKQHLDLCSQLKELEKLQLDCWEESSSLELNELLALSGKKLTSLKINNFCVSLSILAQKCPHLMVLQMDKVNLQHNVNDSVRVFHNLEKVILEKFILIEPVVTQAVTCLLSSAPNLNQLRFKSCELFSSEIKTQILKSCEQCKLNLIDFSSSDVEFVLLRDILLTCSTLETLNLDGCDITHEYEAMEELQTITLSLPNKPQICFDDEEHSSFSDYDEIFMNEYDDYFDTDEEDSDYDVDVDYDDDDDDDGVLDYPFW